MDFCLCKYVKHTCIDKNPWECGQVILEGTAANLGLSQYLSQSVGVGDIQKLSYLQMKVWQSHILLQYVVIIVCSQLG